MTNTNDTHTSTDGAALVADRSTKDAADLPGSEPRNPIKMGLNALRKIIGEWPLAFANKKPPLSPIDGLGDEGLSVGRLCSGIFEQGDDDQLMGGEGAGVVDDHGNSSEKGRWTIWAETWRAAGERSYQ